MRERYPPVQRGQLPTRQHFNGISSIAQRFAGVGKGMRFGRHGESFVSFGDLPPWSQFTFEITETSVDGEDDFYLGKIMWYSHDDSEWKDTETKEWPIDVGGLEGFTFAEGDRVVCFWDEQRGNFIPAGSAGGGISWGKLDGDLTVGGTQIVSLYSGGPAVANILDTGKNVTAGAPPFLTSGQLDSGDWVLIENIGGFWWVTGAPC